ncbi:hypothetical protein AKJ16_DCAP22226, partial [Drosera capensis]
WTSSNHLHRREFSTQPRHGSITALLGRSTTMPSSDYAGDSIVIVAQGIPARSGALTVAPRGFPGREGQRQVRGPAYASYLRRGVLRDLSKVELDLRDEVTLKPPLTIVHSMFGTTVIMLCNEEFIEPCYSSTNVDMMEGCGWNFEDETWIRLGFKGVGVVPFEVPLEVNVVLVGFSGDGGLQAGQAEIISLEKALRMGTQGPF